MYNLEKLKYDRNAEFYDKPLYDAMNYYDDIRILGYYYDIDDKCIISRNGIVTMAKVRYDLHDKYYIISKGKKYILENFLTT